MSVYNTFSSILKDALSALSLGESVEEEGEEEWEVEEEEQFSVNKGIIRVLSKTKHLHEFWDCYRLNNNSSGMNKF